MTRAKKIPGPAIHEVLKRAAKSIENCARSLKGNSDTFTIMRLEMLAKEADRLADYMSRDLLARSIRLETTGRTGTDN